MSNVSIFSAPPVVHHFHGCIDMHGQAIPHGLLFAPGPDECQICTCHNGSASACRTVLCAPPSNCHSIRVVDACCKWICLDQIHPHGGSNFDMTDNRNRNMGSGNSSTDVKLRLVASAITAVVSLALLFFLIYRLRQKRLHNRNRNTRDDELSMDSVTNGMNSNPFPGQPSHRSYWHSLAWWKPTSEDMFESRPAPPSYDDAMMNQPQPNSDELQNNNECSSMESNGSEAPPYSEIHLDPIIPQPQFYNQSEAASSVRPHAVPCGAALVLPVNAPPDFSQLNHVGLPIGEEVPNVQIEPVREPSVSDSTMTLPPSLRRMRARSREAIILPRDERDAVLQRFSLQLNMNMSASSSSSSSQTSPVQNPVQNRRRRTESTGSADA